MTKSRRKSKLPTSQEWASAISDLRRTFKLSQTSFGKKFHSSAMAVSRWERGAQEPTARSYIELGNLAGDPICWYFWGRAGLRHEDLMRILPQLAAADIANQSARFPVGTSRKRRQEDDRG